MINRAVFLTTANILDSSGNGGVKASLEHLQLLQNCLGYENVSVCIYIKKVSNGTVIKITIFLQEKKTN